MYYLRYEQRFEYLSLKSLENRRKIQILTTIFNMKYKSQLIPMRWFKAIKFINNERTGVCPKWTKIGLFEKCFITFAKYIFNDLPIQIRNENN